MKRKFLLFILLITLFSLSACKKVQVFETKEDTSGIPTYKKSSLKNGLIYIKDGAVFMLPSEMTLQGDTYFYFGGFNDIPTLYKGEVLAYCDDTTSDYSSLEIKRLESDGYTFGIYDGIINNNGEYEFADDKILPQAHSYTIFPHNNKNIRIVTLDGQNIDESLVKNGILGSGANLEAKTTHKITCYIGTHYYEGEIKNDVFTFSTFETYTLRNFEQTKNGYLQIAFDVDMKSGYYYIEKQGIFRYVASEKKDAGNLKDIDYYVPLYSKGNLVEKDDSEKSIEGETTNPDLLVQTYSVPINEKQYDYVFTVTYDTNTNIKSPTILLVSPNGATYTFKEEEYGKQQITLAEVAVGEWKIIIDDTAVRVINIDTAQKEDVIATKEVVKSFEVTETTGSQKISITYTGQILNAYIVNKDNEIIVITPKKQGLYEYIFDFVEAGTYKVYVVCTEDSEIEDIEMVDCSNYETEIIVVE